MPVDFHQVHHLQSFVSAVTLTAQAFRLGVPADVLEVFTGVER
jgi:hypothetical protein